jgi:lipoprotein YgeR
MKERKQYLIPCLTLLITFLLAPVSLFCESNTYTVRKGDTLYSIARKFSVALEALLEINGITDPTRVRVGTVIRIPTEGETEESWITYVVRRGDTLYSLSKRFGVSLGALLKANRLTLKSILKVGQPLTIPVAENHEALASYQEAETNEEVSQAPSSVGGADQEKTSEDGEKAENPQNRGVPFWPHPGQVHKLEGKLSSAVAIIGKQGDSVVSVSSGKVTWAAPFRGFGKMVFVKSSNGYVYGYGGHNNLFVKVGDRVDVGTEIGSLGINSHDGIAKVFFFVTKDGKPYEPSMAPRG